MERLVISFFTDNNVTDSVGDVIVSAGHKLTRLRDVMVNNTSDPVIAAACSLSGDVLVTHDGDFRGRDAAKRLGLTRKQYQNKLHKVQLRCLEPSSARRIQEAMSLIEHEWLLIQPDRPMVLEIRDEVIRIIR